MRSTIVAFVLLAFAHVADAQRLFPYADTSGLSVGESLQRILAGEYRGEEGGYLILRAGYYGGASNRPALRQFVSRYVAGRDGYSGSATLALESLWVLGESQDYFMDLARRWDQGTGLRGLELAARYRDPNYWTAYYATRILARQPTGEVISLLDSIHIATNFDGHLGTGVFLARNMAHDIDRYEQTESLRDRIDWAIKWASYGGTPYPGSHFGTEAYLHPKAGVGRRWLEELAQQYPEQVARAIRHFDIPEEEGYTFDEEEWYIRRHLAALANDEVRAMLADCISDEAVYLGCPP